MHADFGRAGGAHRRSRAVLAAAAAVFLLGGWPAHLNAEVSDAVELSSVPPARPSQSLSVVRDIAIETVPAGREGLELSARLTADSGVIQRPIAWTITDAGGQTVYASEIAEADSLLPPGDYTVELKYGAVTARQAMTLVAGTRLIASFVLEAGGLRILPRVQGVQEPQPVQSKSIIYALSGSHAGEVIATSATPGEVLRLPAGDYRIESRFAVGNADAVTDVRVKAGIMSAVEIDHLAGVARLSFVGAPDTVVHWQIADATGAALAAADGLAVSAVLRPGTYVAVAETGSGTLSAHFDIAAGQTRDILLGN